MRGKPPQRDSESGGPSIAPFLSFQPARHERPRAASSLNADSMSAMSPMIAYLLQEPLQCRVAVKSTKVLLYLFRFFLFHLEVQYYSTTRK